MQTKYQIDDLVIIKNENAHFTTSDRKTPIVYKVYLITVCKDKTTQYVMDCINSVDGKTRIFNEDQLDPVPADHPLFTIFGTRPVSAKNENGDG